MTDFQAQAQVFLLRISIQYLSEYLSVDYMPRSSLPVCLQQQFYGEVALFGTDEWDLFFLFSRVSHLGRRINPPFL